MVTINHPMKLVVHGRRWQFGEGEVDVEQEFTDATWTVGNHRTLVIRSAHTVLAEFNQDDWSYVEKVPVEAEPEG